MKKTFNTYLSLVVVVLLSAFANIQANEAVNHTTNPFAVSYCSISHNDAKQSTKTTIVPHRKDTDDRRNVEVIESNQFEDEEASTKKQFYKDYLETAFINALLFEQSSKQLQKSIYHPQSHLSEPRLRLHVQFQVFII
ncbi:hypothetical protein [Winogradskyella vidalii]|uniref:hypothetical protein n=1 Tax=Winogradskyella vidalii TaxID=2615024 RepID=UPI0015C9433D|nr:hypothetical protein [Winogradskyella vidalii]